MVLGLTVVRKGDVHHLSGALDETVDLSPFLAGKDRVLRLNLRGLRSINSLGLRKLIAFAKALGDREVALTDCPTEFIEAVNIMPLVIGGQSKIDRIKSVWVPMVCDALHQAPVTIPLADVRVGQLGVELPAVGCPTCGQAMALTVGTQADDFFFFLLAARGHAQD